ncbi:hypothetical protein L1049_003048 [Liquidambar formosana]|uniref:BAR domain-containing protein n=1 Tax=Liquidambar formosana TaxID=63359 RepID=A0AAP0R9G7_LIQFO
MEEEENVEKLCGDEKEREEGRKELEEEEVGVVKGVDGGNEESEEHGKTDEEEGEYFDREDFLIFPRSPSFREYCIFPLESDVSSEDDGEFWLSGNGDGATWENMSKRKNSIAPLNSNKLRKFARHKNDAKEKRDCQPSAQLEERRDQPSAQLEEKRDHQPSAQLDELAQASQDMQDMRNCYDSLLSAAAATANSAYEFSESLKEMGACLREKTLLNDDEESGRILLMLGKVQFELQKLVDSYRSHIVLTITTPSESLLSELRTVEEMKRQCDEKRKVYEYMREQQREKGRSKSGKGESFTLQQVQTAHDEYDEEATLCVFRLKSLKQGQSRSLLTQVARHHAAQLNFFRKGLKSLEAVEPHVRLVTEMQHIDYQFSGLEDDDGEGWEDDGENAYYANDDGELSFDFRPNKPGPDVVSTLKNSMELDQVDFSIPQASTIENAEVTSCMPFLMVDFELLLLIGLFEEK